MYLTKCSRLGILRVGAGDTGSDNIAQLKGFPDNTLPANPTLIQLALQLRFPTENNDSIMTWGIFYIEKPQPIWDYKI